MLYFATSILVCTIIVEIILQFQYVPELFPANNSRTYQNCQNNSGITSVPELLIQAILGRPRIEVTILKENVYQKSIVGQF